MSQTCQTYEGVLSHMNESCRTYEWVMSNINDSCHTYEWVMSHMNESCHIWMSQVIYECVDATRKLSQQESATHCNILQHIAMHCKTL